MKIIDISMPITTQMPIWPGDPAVELTQIASISNGDIANISRIAMGVHTGTHIDAPKHFIDHGKTIDQIPFSKLIGEVLVIEIDKEVTMISEHVLKTNPATCLLNKIKKVLFRTRNSSLLRPFQDSFNQDYVALDTSGAQFLKNLQLDLIGIDYLSIAAFSDTILPHQILLSSEIVLLEGLDLSNAPAGAYQLYCLPLKILNCEGAPARAILVKEPE